MKNLLALPTDTLLEKFGSGTHAPGSGSAAALMGLLSAKLVLTVGELTLNRKEYQAHHGKVRESCVRIQSVLVPELEALFQEDAETFDRVIQARRARDKATDLREMRRLSEHALDELKLATAIPFRIAEACLELIDHAAIVFDAGFKGARGDTGAALSSAVAGVLSSVFVINLNLKSFRGSYWARQQRKQCDALQETAESKHQAALSRVMKLRTEDVAAIATPENKDPAAVLAAMAKESYSQREIDDRVEIVKAYVWRNKSEIFPDGTLPGDPVDFLSPEIALGLLDYKFEVVTTLGTFRSETGSFEVAGLMEGQIGRVTASAQMPPTVQRFTAAHELGHAVLHPHLKEAHRDRPLDGSTQSRGRAEREADLFASRYLMPEKLVKARFMSTFGISQFVLSDDTAFALMGQGLAEVRDQFQTARELASQLARTTRFNRRHVVPLASQFKVSVETMAIRLDEMELVRRD